MIELHDQPGGPGQVLFTLNVGESIRIGDTITVQVLETRGGRVRFGIEAPIEMDIYRQELAPWEPPPREGEGAG